MIFLHTLYRIWEVFSPEKLAGYGAYPVPQFLITIIKKLPIGIQLGTLAYIVRGNDITSIAPNGLGCAETMSRIIKVLVPDFPILISTRELASELRRNSHFAVSDGRNGDIYMAETGTGAYQNGHVGVRYNMFVLSNNSGTGKMDNHWTVQAFTDYFFIRGRFTRQFYRLIK